ncbi:MAG: hypothetical protein ACREHC_08335 [Candidatus Levyibacteriota bacterium]
MKVLRSIIAVVLLIAIVYFVSQYSGLIQEKIGVKGASTSRAQEIGGQISSDVGKQVDTAKNQAMHVSLSDVMNYLSRFQRIPQDVNNAKDYVGQQYSNMVESKHAKK